MSFIEIKDLTKQYVTMAKPVLALRGLNLDINQNEICTIMGPSGCGKSTLLNILGAIDEPTSGFARVGDFPITAPTGPIYQRNKRDAVKYRRHNVGFIFQFHNLSPVHTALENIELPLIFSGTPREIRKKRALSLLHDVGLENRADHRPDQLSGGERQRIAVATAFSNNPSLILADEPTGELDQENTDMICDLIAHLKKEKDFTMLLVTHNPVVAKLGDDVYNMRDGVIRGTISKNVLNNISDPLKEIQTELKTGILSNEFPPKFCSSCGSSNMVTPTFDTKTGFWLEATKNKRLDYEFEFAQCLKCSKIFWNVKSINM